jgi:hypothetical protein
VVLEGRSVAVAARDKSSHNQPTVNQHGKPSKYPIPESSSGTDQKGYIKKIAHRAELHLDSVPNQVPRKFTECSKSKQEKL